MSSISVCTSVNMENYQKLLTHSSADTVICVRGKHAVGKSEGVYQSAARRRSDFYKDPDNCARMVEALSDPTHKAVKHATGWVTEWNYEMGVPVVERRLSQMTEGDMIGLPFKTIVAEQECTQFLACDWIIQSCHFPVVLFLDERNRALDGVKQSVFQLADSKAFYGNRLHPEAQIIVAENVGDDYQVNQNDPAEISRYVTVELDPTFEEFMEYAESKLHPAIVEYLRTNPRSLEHRGTYEPNKKYPDRRSWFKFSSEAKNLNLLDDDENTDLTLMRILAGGHLGVEIGNHFFNFFQEMDRQVKAKEVLEDWKKVRQRLRKRGTLSNEKYVEIVQKLGDHINLSNEGKGIDLNESQCKQLARFMHDCPSEPRMACWTILQKNAKNLFAVHPLIEKLMVATATGDRTIQAEIAEEQKTEDEEQKEKKPTRRGRRR